LSTETLIASYLRLAEESIKASHSLLREGNRNAVYNAQQAVEMIVLALAQSEAVHFARSQQHQLDAMIRGLPDGNAFKSTLSDLS
jgi:HEPN domain-containing protein